MQTNEQLGARALQVGSYFARKKRDKFAFWTYVSRSGRYFDAAVECQAQHKKCKRAEWRRRRRRNCLHVCLMVSCSKRLQTQSLTTEVARSESPGTAGGEERRRPSDDQRNLHKHLRHFEIAAAPYVRVRRRNGGWEHGEPARALAGSDG